MENEQLRALGRLEGKVDVVLSNQMHFNSKLDAYDGRLRKVETRIARMGAFAAGAGALVGAISSFLMRFKLNV